MKTAATVIAVAVAGLFSAAASAQTVGSEVQRDVNQQQRIEQGLKSGSLNTGEAARLERGEARIDRMESNAMKDGKLSPAEKARIQRAQNQESRQINRLENNAARGARSGEGGARRAPGLREPRNRPGNLSRRIGRGRKRGPRRDRAPPAPMKKPARSGLFGPIAGFSASARRAFHGRCGGSACPPPSGCAAARSVRPFRRRPRAPRRG